MFIGYERPVKGYQKRAIAPYVSLNKRGEIVVNPAAWELMGRAVNVVLFYDEETKRIGIKGATQRDLDLKVFYARRHGRGGRLRIIRARRLLKQFGITITETLVFRDLKVEPGPILVLELGDAEMSRNQVWPAVKTNNFNFDSAANRGTRKSQEFPSQN
jgi:hypothetical protein